MNKLLVAALICAPAAHAAFLNLRIASPVAVHIMLNRADSGAPAIERDLPPGDAHIEVPEGTWQLDARAPGFWHQRQVVKAGANEEVRLWPATSVTGQAEFADHDDSATELTIRFTFRDGPSGEETCSIKGKRFACNIPAGIGDLAIRTRGHVTQYLSSASLVRGKAHDLGVLTFVRGATLAGRVEPPRGIKIALESVTITAAPAQVKGSKMMSSVSAHPNARGFFHLDGIAPGEYNVVASVVRQRLSSPSVAVLVIHGAEATISRPLVISVPHALTIDVDPPVDPWAKQWRITMIEQTEVLARALVPLTGSYRSQPLNPGRYTIRIGAQDDSIWFSEEIDVDEKRTSLLIPLRLARVRGSVHLGYKPLAATVWIGGEHGVPRVEMHSDDSGEFAGYIPHRDGESWPVTVQSESPMAKRNFSVVKLRRRDDGDLQADLRLDLTMLQGEIVDEKEAPVANASVNVTGLEFDEFIQPNSAADGRFTVFGLRPGRYTITAMHTLRESKPVQVDIRETEEPPFLRLVLLPNRQLKGIVRSDSGAVPGAKVTVWPADVTGDLIFTAHSDETGFFSAVVTPGAEQLNVLVEPSGFALKLFHVQYERRLLAVTLKQDGGSLTVEGLPAADVEIEHSGARLPLVSLTFRPETSKNGDHTVIGNLEPGSYTVCPRSGRTACAAGYLPPYGTLDLSLHKPGNL